jgi:hypothetical protein
MKAEGFGVCYCEITVTSALMFNRGSAGPEKSRDFLDADIAWPSTLFRVGKDAPDDVA